MFAEDVLRKYYWQAGREVFNELQIFYISRGGDGVIQGSDVETMGKLGLELHGGSIIPYHRIIKIELHGMVVFDRYDERRKARERKNI